MEFRLKGASGDLTGKPFELEEETVIGSAETAAIQLDGLEERHALIRWDGQLLVLDSAGPCWVNGEEVTHRPLQSGDELRLGPHRFVLQAPGLRPPSVLNEAPPRARISPWTWVAIAGAGAAGVTAFIYLVTQTPSF